MSLVLMRLGTHTFYVPVPEFDTPSFDTFQRDSQFSWVPQGRLSRDPALQFTGPGEDNVTIEGRLFPHHFGGLSTLDGLYQSGREGKPLQLTRFRPLQPGYEGEILGKFVIRRVRQNHSRIGATGVAHKIDFTLELTAYGDDPAGSSGSEGFLFT